MGKSSDKNKDLTYYPLQLLIHAGLHPSIRSKWLTLHACTSWLGLVLVCLLAAIEAINSYEINKFDCLESLSYVLITFQIIINFLIMLKNRPLFVHLMDQKSKFWEIEDFEGEIFEELRTVVSVFLVQPFLTHLPPARVYIPEGYFYWVCALIFYVSPGGIGGAHAPVLTFSSICIPVVIQFKLLSYRFQTLTASNLKHDLKKLIDYHNFLIDYCEQIKIFANGLLVVQFFGTISVCCIQMFITMENQFIFWVKFECFGYFMSLMIVTGIYCVSAELISESSENVGVSVYNSLWYETSTFRLRQSIILVIGRAQNKIIFSGYGFILFNIETFTNIFKTTLSFYSYISTMVVNK